MNEPGQNSRYERNALSERQFALEAPLYRAGLRDVRAGRGTALTQQVKFYRRMDEALREEPLPDTVAPACKAGCAYCCHYHVYIFAPEALAIAEYLQSEPVAVRETAIEKLRVNASQIADLSVAEHLQTNVACAFLTPQNTCGIYKVRPWACRKHHSFDVQPCITTFENPTAQDMTPQSVSWLGLADGFLAASVVAQRQEGFDPRRYEMSTAVLEALSNRAAPRRWKDGKRTFATVRDFDEASGA